MLYLVIIIGIIGFSLWVELKDEKKHEVNDKSKGNPNSNKRASRVDDNRDNSWYGNDDELEYDETFEQARTFVEQLKERRASDLSENPPVADFDIEPNVDSKKSDKTHIDKDSIRKSILQVERETAEIQARTEQALQELEQMCANVKSDVPEKHEVPEYKTAFFKDTDDLRRAFVVSEILSKPLSLRR